jgi:hypothetical protein
MIKSNRERNKEKILDQMAQWFGPRPGQPGPAQPGWVRSSGPDPTGHRPSSLSPIFLSSRSHSHPLELLAMVLRRRSSPAAPCPLWHRWVRAFGRHAMIYHLPLVNLIFLIPSGHPRPRIPSWSPAGSTAVATTSAGSSLLRSTLTSSTKPPSAPSSPRPRLHPRSNT